MDLDLDLDLSLTIFLTAQWDNLLLLLFLLLKYILNAVKCLLNAHNSWKMLFIGIFYPLGPIRPKYIFFHSFLIIHLLFKTIQTIIHPQQRFTGYSGYNSQCGVVAMDSWRNSDVFKKKNVEIRPIFPELLMGPHN